MRNSAKGHVLLMLLVVIVLGGLVAAQRMGNQNLAQEIALQKQARQSEALEQIRSSLLAFAASQGIHSQSHLGHLPCPALLPGDPPQTVCLDKPWGYLPVHSKTAINYLNAGIDPRFDENRITSLKHWEYAVSAQLVQPNEMNWGRWVDYTQPSIRITVPQEDNRSQSQLVAVIAQSLQPIAPHHYRVEPPYAFITQAQLQAMMKQAQVRQIHQTFSAWRQLNPAYSQQLNNHENLITAAHINQLVPHDSACSCRCTRTRCTCSCSGAGQWRSDSACWGNSSHCETLPTHTRCTSQDGQACVFSGPASLQNGWPVSRFEPVAAQNKSCRPVRPNECPLSRDAGSCTCDFSWPDNTKPDLAKYRIEHTP